MGRKIRTLRVSSKGQIVLPADIRSELGIDVGTDLVMFFDGRRIVLEPESDVADKLAEDFSDLLQASEAVLRGVWDNDADEVWNDA